MKKRPFLLLALLASLPMNSSAAALITGTGVRGVGTWRSHTNANYVAALAAEGNSVWAGTEGGVVHWEGSKGTKYATADGLPDNAVFAVAVDGSGHKRNSSRRRLTRPSARCLKRSGAGWARTSGTMARIARSFRLGGARGASEPDLTAPAGQGDVSLNQYAVGRRVL